jgi:DNA-binding MarR family transcriptional regulator
MMSSMATTRTGRSQNGAKAAPATEAHREAWLALCRAYAGLTGRLQEALTDAGLPPMAWFEVLNAVARAPDERMKMGDLASALIISRGGLTKLVDRLVRAGLLERAFCVEDRRVSYAVMTASGREMFAEMEPVVVRELKAAFPTSLSGRQAAALRDSLDRISATTCSG